MHCRACDKLLSDKETTRKLDEDYPDLCDVCFGSASEIVAEVDEPFLEIDDFDETFPEGEENAIQSEDTPS